MFQIMVVEDDKSTARLMQTVLTYEGYAVILAGNGEEALEIMDRQQIDLIILDIMMPKMDGYEFTETLRSVDEHTPILMVTAKQLPEDKCKGFLVGTDDYMVKPVNYKEMVLRVKALLRRSQIANERKLHIGKVTLDYDSLTVSREGESQTLPQKEFYLLYKLLSYPGQIFTRLQLMDEIWGKDSTSTDTTVNVHIAWLRKRFAGWPEFELVSIRGIGYKAVIHHG
ncbi:MAG: response regulator transcription factor [Lachnospiraceae bacterium]|nr:response regulator transcription factor [Lachnospiraceae bacterium]